MIEDCTALILAGGESRRMGQDKATLLLNGKTLLEQVTLTMQSVFPKVVVSVKGKRIGIKEPQVCDEQLESGPLVGLISGMAQIDTPWVFAVACDMPFIVSELVEQLAMFRIDLAAPKLLNTVQAVVPMIGGYPQPLAAFYATSALAILRETVASGEKSFRGALDKLNVRYVSETELRASDPQLNSFFDLDTPQDWLEAGKLKGAERRRHE